MSLPTCGRTLTPAGLAIGGGQGRPAEVLQRTRPPVAQGGTPLFHMARKEPSLGFSLPWNSISVTISHPWSCSQFEGAPGLPPQAPESFRRGCRCL